VRQALLVLLATGCHSYKPVTTPSRAVAHHVRVRFTESRTVAGHLMSGADSLLRNVRVLEGRILSTLGDTVQMAITKYTDSVGEHPLSDSITADIALGSTAIIDSREISATRTGFAAGGVILAAVAVSTVVALVALLSSIGGS
jgi:hypothetical protein